jgi:hypothetical protein
MNDTATLLILLWTAFNIACALDSLALTLRQRKGANHDG